MNIFKKKKKGNKNRDRKRKAEREKEGCWEAKEGREESWVMMQIWDTSTKLSLQPL